MPSMASGSALIVSSETFAVVSLPEGDVPLAALLSQGCMPLEERIFLIPESVLPQLPPGASVAAGGWRRVVVAGVLASSELVAAASWALAEVEVPVLVFSRAGGLWLFVPEEKLGRALAALRQARLGRFAGKP